VGRNGGSSLFQIAAKIGSPASQKQLVRFVLKLLNRDFSTGVGLQICIELIEFLHTDFARSGCLNSGAEFLKVHAYPVKREATSAVGTDNSRHVAFCFRGDLSFFFVDASAGLSEFVSTAAGGAPSGFSFFANSSCFFSRCASRCLSPYVCDRMKQSLARGRSGGGRREFARKEFTVQQFTEAFAD
jgi:hypothetical protein